MNPSTDASAVRRRSALHVGLLCAALALGACQTGGPTRPQPPPSEPDEEVFKGDPQARLELALSMWDQNDLADAEQALVGLTTDFPDYSGPWTNLGILYAKSNRKEQARAALAKAASLNAQNKVAFNWLGILAREAGDFERARQAYEKALAIDPGYALAHYNLGVLLDAHLRRPLDALPHYRSYQTLAGEEDLRVMAWIAAIETSAQAAAPQPPATGTAPEQAP